MYKVLVIEGNQELAGTICDHLEQLGMELDYANNGEQGLKLALESNFDTIILDPMLPRMDGFSVCRELRAKGKDTPILMLSALDSTQHILAGFENGTDDYVTKPFEFSILEARVKALIKRYRGSVTSSEIHFSSLRIDQKLRKAYREDTQLNLNPTGYTILHQLCLKAPQVVTREELIEKLWPDTEPGPDALRAHIYQLRSQLDKPFSTPMLITIPKVGFRLEDISSQD